LKNATPEERQAFLKEHPEIAERLKERGENLSPEQKEKLKAKMKERLEKMTPEERAEFFKKHPEAKEKLEEAKK
jgi:2-oxo-4-hydroxy-4-carboxy--5-ureidoimidazoline (OHCU) decarboxylase